MSPIKGWGNPRGTWDELSCPPREHGMSSHVSGGRRLGGGEREITQGGTWDELPCEWGGGEWEITQGGHGMSSHVSGGGGDKGGAKISPSLLWGDRMSSHVPQMRREELILPLPCLHPPTHMGAHPMSPLGNLPLSSPHSHGSSSHVSPWVIGEGTCNCQIVNTMNWFILSLLLNRGRGLVHCPSP